MIRPLLIALCLASPLHAQNTSQDLDLPDVTLLRDSGMFDFSAPPPLVIQQAIAVSEDRDYFETFPAFSPVSQAIVRNTLLNSRRTLTRAAMEMRLGSDLANAYSSQEIMTMFAQRIYLGANCFGFEDTLDVRLGVAIEDVSIAQALTLATLIKFPTIDAFPDRYEPHFGFLAREGVTAGFWDEATAEALIEGGPAPLIEGSNCTSDP